MIKRIAALFAALLLGLGGALVASQPAQAAFPNGCPTPGYFCLYAGTSYTGGRWQGSVYSLDGGANWPDRGPCWNLSGSSYTTGGNVNNSSASWTMTANTAYDEGYYFVISDWVNCNSAGQQALVKTYVDGNHPLNTYSNGWEALYKPTSIQLVCLVSPPCTD